MTRTIFQKQPAGNPTPFLSFADQGMYLAHTAIGQQAVVQALWRYRRPVDLDALTRFRAALAQGRLARLIQPAVLPFGRHQWITAPAPSTPLAFSETPLPVSQMQAWADAQVELPLDPAKGPAWTFSMENFDDGTALVSLVVSHCIADGLTIAQAVGEAVRGDKCPVAYPARRVATLRTEIAGVLRDAPGTLRALGHFMRMARPSRRTAMPVAPPNATVKDRSVVFPTVFVRFPTAAWDARARSLGSNRFTLLNALTVAFAEALGRVHEGHVTLMIPVNQREGPSQDDANRVSLATVKVPAGTECLSLPDLQRSVRTAVLRARREPDQLAALLPLTPFVPRRAFAAASHFALAALAELPVTCSNLGHFPDDLLLIDGARAERLCFRGVDHRITLGAIEARRGVATLFAGVVEGHLALSFVACQPGVVTEARELRLVVERLLADFELTGEFFYA